MSKRHKSSFLDGELTESTVNLQLASTIPPPSSQLQTTTTPTPSGIYKVERSALFSQLDMFIPKLKEANEVLEKNIAEHGAAQYSIENISPDTKDVIKMCLTLGVLEENGSNAVDESTVMSTNEIIHASQTGKYSNDSTEDILASHVSEQLANVLNEGGSNTNANTNSNSTKLISIVDDNMKDDMNDDMNDDSMENVDGLPFQVTKIDPANLDFMPVRETDGGSYSSKDMGSSNQDDSQIHLRNITKNTL